MPMPNLSMRISDRLTRQTIDVLRVSAGMRAAVLRDLRRLERELVQSLIDRTGSELTQARMRELLAQTRESIDAAYGKIAAKSTGQLKRVATQVGRDTVRGVNRIVRTELMSVSLSTEQAEWIASKAVVNGKYPHEWWKRQAPLLRDRFANEIRMGQYRGESVDEMVRRIRGTKANGYTDGIMQASKRQAEALVRTSVISVANEAKLATYQNNRDVIKGIQWEARLDDRTTDICRELHGKVWRLPEAGDKDADYIPDGHSTPFPGATAHWNCRSVQIPVTFSFEELEQRE